MIYHFKIISQESKRFLLKVGIDGNHTFFDFHKVIQDCSGFQSFNLASFFISDGNWSKQKEISLLDSGVNEFPFFNMHKTRISDLIKPQTKHLLYTFDLFNDRSYYVELTEISMEKNLKEPVVSLEQGNAPSQVLEEDFEAKELTIVQEDEILHDFGVLEDYTEIFGEMEDF